MVTRPRGNGLLVIDAGVGGQSLMITVYREKILVIVADVSVAGGLPRLIPRQRRA
jgi:hypothetical protein